MLWDVWIFINFFEFEGEIIFDELLFSFIAFSPLNLSNFFFNPPSETYSPDLIKLNSIWLLWFDLGVFLYIIIGEVPLIFNCFVFDDFWNSILLFVGVVIEWEALKKSLDEKLFGIYLYVDGFEFILIN